VYELVNLHDVLEAAIGDSYTILESRSIKLSIDIESDIFIMGDAVLLKKAFRNVLDNAAIYSPEGSQVTVQLARNQNKAILTIANSGSHIDEEHLPHLFEAFYRGDRHTGGYRHGSGLGLYITQMILENHRVTHGIENFEAGVMFTAVFSCSKNSTQKTQNSTQSSYNI
jgi:two-component system sensor histidine kinase VanS